MAQRALRISALIRSAISQSGLGVEAFRRRHRLPNTLFYRLLDDDLPAKVETRKTWRRRLAKAGVDVGTAL